MEMMTSHSFISCEQVKYVALVVMAKGIIKNSVIGYEMR